MLSVTNIFVIISFFSTLIVMLFPELYLFGMNNVFLSEGNYLYFSLQFLFYSFIHGGLFHFISNSLFLYYFWNEVERILKDAKYLGFFVLTTLSVAFSILIWWSGNTVWISGFCMAVMTYYTLELYYRWNTDYRWGLTAIAINVALGFIPWISLIWHFSWAICWFLFFHFNKRVLGRVWKESL